MYVGIAFLESGNEETEGRELGIGRGPLLLLLVVASITVEINFTRHTNESTHIGLVSHFWGTFLAQHSYSSDYQFRLDD